MTISVVRKNIEKLGAFLSVGNDLTVNSKIGFTLTELGNSERLRLIHDFFRIGEEEHFSFDFATLAQRGQDFKDNICPDSIRFRSIS